MIKLLLLAVVPFMTEHRNVSPRTEVSTNFYGSVTGIVDNAYIQAHGGGGVNTNAVLDIVRDEIIPATNRLNQTLGDAISGKLDVSPDRELYPHVKIYWDGEYLNIDGYVSMNRGLSVAATVYAASYESSLWYDYVANGETLPTYLASGNWNTAPDPFVKKSKISADDPTFSNAVLSVGLNIDTNSVAVLNEIASTFGGFPIEGTATTVGGLLAALAAAIAWLKKNKIGSFASVGGSSAIVENGVAKLDDFFTESNSLLTGTIDAEVISKGTAPDAHLEAPTDEHLKLILADNSVAYDSEKALPYKLTSVIGNRVIATMTLTAASTDITLPTISANDTTVKDFILDVTNAYAVEGVATDAGINIPRTDFKLVTRDGESLTDVTTVKAGKSAFICFTQKSPVVVGGTTYPCWCVIQLPFGDPS